MFCKVIIINKNYFSAEYLLVYLSNRSKHFSLVDVRSKAWVCGLSLAGIADSNPARGMECCVLSGRGCCVGLITRPKESYRVWCV
jgi:hypothetical protein